MTKPVLRMITLPYRANWLGKDINQLLFPDRHTLTFGTVDESGEWEGVEDWMMIESHEGTLLPPMTTADNILEEAGIFQHGADTVMLKSQTRRIVLNFRLFGKDRAGYELARRKFACLFGLDNATSAVGAISYPATTPPPPQFHTIAEPFELPNPWTYTYQDANETRYHLDFNSYVRISGDNDVSDAYSLRSSITIHASNPFFYEHEEITIPFNGEVFVYNGIVTPEGYPDINPNPATAFATPEFIYNGCARTPVIITIDRAPGRISSVGIFNVDDNVPARFRHVNWPTGIPLWNDIGAPLTFNGYNNTFVTVLGTNLAANAHPLSNFRDLDLIPGKTYRVFVDVTDTLGASLEAEGSIRYRNQYWGI